MTQDAVATEGRRQRNLWIGLAIFVVATIVVGVTVGREIYAGRNPSLRSFGVINFAGYLFFLTMPVEALVPWYQSLGHAPLTLIGLALATAVLAQIIDYGIGVSVKDEWMDRVLGAERHRRAARTLHRHGAWGIFIFNLFPLSSPILMLAAGMARYGLGRALIYSVSGLIAKYLAIVYLFRELG